MFAYASIGFAIALLVAGGAAAALSRRNAVRNVALVMAGVGAALLIVELGALAWVNVPKLWGYTTAKHYAHEGHLGSRGGPLGYAPLADNTVTESSYLGRDPVFEGVHYAFDAKARRVVPLPHPAPKHALFFGGSYVFGEGLPNDQTVSARFQGAAQGEFQAYNYAYKGYGPNQMYCLLQDDTKFDDIPQHDGVAVYGFIQNHIWRTVGAPWQLATVPGIPIFRLDADGRLEGPMTYDEIPAMERRVGWYTFLQTYSPLGRLLVSKKFLRAVRDDEAMRTTAAVIVASAKAYKTRFQGEFYTVIWPRRRLAPAIESQFIALLEAGGVRVLQPPPLPNPQEAMLHPVDEHPSAKEVDWIAQHVYEAIEANTHETTVE